MAEKAGYIRFGSFARPASVSLIEQFCEKHGVSKGALAEILTLGISQQPPEIAMAIVKAGKDHVGLHNEDGRKKRGKLLKSIKNLPLAELEQLVSTLPEKGNNGD